MIVTKKYIQDLREKSLLKISKKTEKLILEKFGKELKIDENGYFYEYSEQDICEQIREMIRAK